MSGSRLIVKNLPNSITTEKLRKSFSSKGFVTDVQLKFTKDGTFRHFGFIGFKNSEEAENAKKYFDGTFVGATKISVELCSDLGDASKPRAWSRYSSDSSVFQKLESGNSEIIDEPTKERQRKKDKKEKVTKADQLLLKFQDDSKFQEFLKLRGCAGAATARNNNAISEVRETCEKDAATADGGQDSWSVGEPNVAFDSKVSDLDYLKSLRAVKGDGGEDVQDGERTEEENKIVVKENAANGHKQPKNENYYTVKLYNLPYKSKKKDVKKFLLPLKPKSIRVPPKIRGIAYAGFATEKEWKTALSKNKGFVGSKQVFVVRYDNRKKHYELERKRKETAWKEQEESLRNAESVAESGRLFIRNLPYTVTEDELEELFKPFGPLTEVSLPIDKITRKVKGFAFVTYVIPENAVKAFNLLDGTTFQGRLLHLIPGKAKPSDELDVETEGNPSSYKKQKAAKEKAKAQSSHNWNVLFLGTSAVADVMAETYGVTKRDVLGDQGGKQSAAVRLALGETQIVFETRRFLEEQGVSLDAFGRHSTKRSKTVIIVKNLPASTSVEEIRDAFVKHGELGRVVLPPGGITALVEFYEAIEARSAFRKLAYSKFKGTPLYLEWAPDGSFSTESEKPAETAAKPQAEERDQSRTPEDNTTLFVKNLNFSTDEEQLKQFFSSAVGGVFSTTVATKKDPKQVGAKLSMGYGFVQFYKASDASEALKTLQHKQLDGHSVELKRSNRAPTAEQSSASAKSPSKNKEPVTKMVVRNVPFEATAKEVEEIFKTFGQLKTVRLPKKVTGSHRGFAFVDFHSVEEAKKAFEALCHSTHLYGRRLVLDWAEGEETVEDLRKKTAASFVGDPPSKRIKKSQVVESLLES